jgi:hypothetical protein
MDRQIDADAVDPAIPNGPADRYRGSCYPMDRQIVAVDIVTQWTGR